MIFVGGLVVAGLTAAGIAVVGRWRVAREERAIAELKATLERGGGDASAHHSLGLQLASRQDRASALAHLEMAAEKTPDDLRFGNDFRLSCARFGEYDRNIRFFERLVERNGPAPEPQLQLALAYVDKMPDHMMGIVGQSKLSNRSISRLTKVLSNEVALGNEQTHWAALYALGLNHLYWPKALRHAPIAIETFERCIEFQKTMKDPSSAFFVLPYVALGDAHVKDGRHEEARAIWRDAQGRFQDDPRLRERLAVASDAELTKYMDTVRGLGIPVDTDLSILWGRAP